MRVYDDRNLPEAVVIGDVESELWIVPAIADGWRMRRPYKIVSAAMRLRRLRELPSYHAMGLGVEVEQRPIEQIIGDRIEAARKTARLTQVDLAGKLGVSQGTVSGWDRGHCLPTTATWRPLCEALGVTESELFGG